MSIEPRKPYRIVNKMAGLALDISNRDHKSIIGKYVEPVDSQTWIIEPLPIVGAYIKSKATGLYIGFESGVEVGSKLIMVGRGAAGIWDVQPDNRPDYKIKPDDTSFVIEFPKTNLEPGTQAQLGQDHGDEETNQIWVITKIIVD